MRNVGCRFKTAALAQMSGACTSKRGTQMPAIAACPVGTHGTKASTWFPPAMGKPKPPACMPSIRAQSGSSRQQQTSSVAAWTLVQRVLTLVRPSHLWPLRVGPAQHYLYAFLQCSLPENSASLADEASKPLHATSLNWSVIDSPPPPGLGLLLTIEHYAEPRTCPCRFLQCRAAFK